MKTTLLFLILILFTPVRAEERPNVILILADDMAIGDISIFNKVISRTPRLYHLTEYPLEENDLSVSNSELLITTL